MLAKAITTAAKVAILVGIVAIIIAAFVGIQIPAGNWNAIIAGIGTAKAIIGYYVPAIYVLLPVMMALLSIEYGLKLIRGAIVAARWLMRILD